MRERTIILVLLALGLLFTLPPLVGYYRELRALRQAVQDVATELRAVRALVPPAP